MKKWLNVILIAALMFITGKAFAQIATDYGYVIVRCTVAISVDVLDSFAEAWFVDNPIENGLSPNQEAVSISSIGVRNTSNGAVLKYAVMVSSIQRSEDGINWISDDDDTGKLIKGWTLTQDGILDSVGEFQLAMVFAKSRPGTGDFQIGGDTPGADEFRVNLAGGNPSSTQLSDYTYKTNGDRFDPNTSGLRYPSALGNQTGTNAILPHPYTDSTREMWFYIKTPSAVTDTHPRRIIIRVFGGLGNAW